MNSKKMIMCIFLIALKSIAAHAQSVAFLNDSSIVYMLPHNVDSLLKRTLDTGSYYFYLEGCFKHYEIREFKVRDDKSLLDWLRSTHRVIFLNQTFYPLVFETDELFGSITTRPGGKMKQFNRKYLSSQYSIANIDFTYDGKIISNFVELKK